MSIRRPQTIYLPYKATFVNYFHATQIQNMLFRLLKDA